MGTAVAEHRLQLLVKSVSPGTQEYLVEDQFDNVPCLRCCKADKENKAERTPPSRCLRVSVHVGHVPSLWFCQTPMKIFVAVVDMVGLGSVAKGVENDRPQPYRKRGRENVWRRKEETTLGVFLFFFT